MSKRRHNASIKTKNKTNKTTKGADKKKKKRKNNNNNKEGPQTVLMITNKLRNVIWKSLGTFFEGLALTSAWWIPTTSEPCTKCLDLAQTSSSGSVSRTWVRSSQPERVKVRKM